MNQEVRRKRYEHSHKKYKAREQNKDSKETWTMDPEETTFLQNKLEVGTQFLDVMSQQDNDETAVGNFDAQLQRMKRQSKFGENEEL